MDAEQLIRILLAVVLGFVGGWIVKSIVASGRRRRDEATWKQQLDSAKEARKSESDKVIELRSRCRELESSLAGVQGEMTQIRDNVQAREQSVSALRADLFAAKAKIEEMDALRAKLAEREEKLIEMNKARTELARQAMDTSELESHRAELEVLSARASQLETENASLLEDRTRLSQQLHEEQQKKSELPQPASTKQIPNLPVTPPMNPALSLVGSSIGRPSDGESTEVAAMRRKLGQRDAMIDKLRKDLDASRQHLSTFQQRLHRLEVEKGNGATPPEQSPPPPSEPENRAEPPVEQHEEPQAESLPEQKARLSPEKPGSEGVEGATETAQTPDDLTKIRGIGAKLQSTLYELGIVSYTQLAEMSRSDLEALSEQLTSFKNRPFRDDWIKQARTLLQNQR